MVFVGVVLSVVCGRGWFCVGVVRVSLSFMANAVAVFSVILWVDKSSFKDFSFMPEIIAMHWQTILIKITIINVFGFVFYF